MLVRFYLVLCLLLMFSSCIQEPAPVIYKDRGNYISKPIVYSDHNQGFTYVDYNNQALQDMQNTNDLNFSSSNTFNSDNVQQKKPVVRKDIFANAVNKIEVANVEIKKDLPILEDVKNNIIVEFDSNDFLTKEDVPEFTIPMIKGYFHRQSEVDKLTGRVYVMSSVSGDIIATAAGKVVYVGDRRKGDKLKDYNNLIIIEHNNSIMSVYANLDNIKINVGDVVDKSQLIASVNRKHGRDYELNFSMRFNKKEIINPKDYIVH